ncbi:MAG: YraN family protein [Limisphaerales bacterium]|jgi:putative endonuclease
MNFIRFIKLKLKSIFFHTYPEHLIRGIHGEKAAKKYLKSKGLKFLTANYNSGRGEIDLIFRERDCLVFVEVKTRSSEEWTRPSKAVDARKRRLISLAAMDYLKLLKNQNIKFRFDIVEVLVTQNNKISQIRHLPSAFPLSKPFDFH